jgi:plastocyanin
VLLLGLSTGNKVGLALVAAGFAGFSLIVSMLVPRWRPLFPGRGLPVFLVVCVLMFLGMLTAVEIFGKESESEAAGGETTGQTEPSGPTGPTGPTAPAARTVKVDEVDFKIRLPETTLKAGTYSFQVQNDGKVPHDLVVKGAGVQEGTPEIAPGASKSLKVELKAGSYDFYCSVPGHKQLGMDQPVTVS